MNKPGILTIIALGLMSTQATAVGYTPSNFKLRGYFTDGTLTVTPDASDIIGFTQSISGNRVIINNFVTEGYSFSSIVADRCCSVDGPIRFWNETLDGSNYTLDFGFDSILYNQGAIVNLTADIVNGKLVNKKALVVIGGQGDAESSYFFQLRGNAVVPEPSSWAMMICGFGFIGASMRRRQADLPLRAGGKAGAIDLG